MDILTSMYIRKITPPTNSIRQNVLQKSPQANPQVALTSTCAICRGAAGKDAVVNDCGFTTFPIMGAGAATPVTIGTWDTGRAAPPRCAPHDTQNCWLAAFWEPQFGHIAICCIFSPPDNYFLELYTGGFSISRPWHFSSSAVRGL